MSTEARSTFRITGWKEEPYQESEDGPKLTKAAVTQTYEGTLVGDSSIEYLMCHISGKSSTFVGLELFRGTVEGKKGSFVMEHQGTFDGAKARSSWKIVPGSGTENLTDIRGEGTYEAGHGEPARVEFRYSLNAE